MNETETTSSYTPAVTNPVTPAMPVVGLEVRSLQNDPVTEAVLSSHAAPAPSDPLEQRLQALENRVIAAEEWVSTHSAQIEALQSLAAAEVPALDPAINRLTQLEQWAAAVADHFMNKIPAPPVAPKD